MNLDEPYQTIILDHYREKHHSGLRKPYETKVHYVSPSYGDELTLRVYLGSDTIADASYNGGEYSISQASTPISGDFVIGRDANHFSGFYDDFLGMTHFKREITPNEDHFEDAIASTGASKFPAHIKYALLA